MLKIAPKSYRLDIEHFSNAIGNKTTHSQKF